MGQEPASQSTLEALQKFSLLPSGPSCLHGVASFDQTGGSRRQRDLPTQTEVGDKHQARICPQPGQPLRRSLALSLLPRNPEGLSFSPPRRAQCLGDRPQVLPPGQCQRQLRAPFPRQEDTPTQPRFSLPLLSSAREGEGLQ